LDEGGSGDGASLFEKAPWREPLGTLEDMLRKSLDMGICLHGGPFPSVGIVVFGWGDGSGISGSLIDE